MSEPQTEAGRILLLEHSSGTPHMARHILAIEAQARADNFMCHEQYAKGRADALREAAEKVRAVRPIGYMHTVGGDVVSRDAVLAILEPQSEEQPR